MNVKCLIQIILAALVLSGCGHFDKWTREDKIFQGIQLGMHGIDWLQTREIARNDDFYETNPHLGKYPTVGEVDRYMLVSAGLGVLITHILPQGHRKYWQMFWIGASTSSVVHNYHIGIRIKL